MNWAVIVHGGARTIAPAMQARNRAGCAAAAGLGAACFASGASAVEAVAAAIAALEDNPVFNAGYGSVLTRAGTVEMDAALMDGQTLDVGAVACVRRLRHPIRAAGALLRAGPVFLCGQGAEDFAVEAGMALCPPEAMIAPERAAGQGHDTVGAVAIDARGHIAAGTSTGGLSGKRPGRIGDSPLPGCGLLADDTLGGVALSGEGEAMIRVTLAAHILQGLADMGAMEAARLLPARMARVGGEAGAIVIDRLGALGLAHNSRHFAVGLQTADMAGPIGLIDAGEWETQGHGR